MGTFEVAFEIGDPQGQRWESVEALVDTGSTFTWVPSEVLDKLGVRREGKLEFETADERVIERDVGQTWIRYGTTLRITLVVFGDMGSNPLVGAYALEGLLLAVDPVHQRLVPVRALAK